MIKKNLLKNTAILLVFSLSNISCASIKDINLETATEKQKKAFIKYHCGLIKDSSTKSSEVNINIAIPSSSNLTRAKASIGKTIRIRGKFYKTPITVKYYHSNSNSISYHTPTKSEETFCSTELTKINKTNIKLQKPQTKLSDQTTFSWEKN